MLSALVRISWPDQASAAFDRYPLTQTTNRLLGGTAMRNIKPYAIWILSIYIAIVFVQSLFFKFTGAEESIYIFSTLRAWSGISLFEPAGRWIIGSAELVASILLLTPRLRVIGAAMAIGIMTGAIYFHLFTPLGVNILGDGGELFTLACGVWISGWVILALSKEDVRGWIFFARRQLGMSKSPAH
jgi:uncharacterized membrane protein YphA (DoxX/SURF4 family)